MANDIPEPSGGTVDRGPQALILFWVTGGVAILTVGLRFLGRHMRRSIGSDDWIMLATLALYIMYVGILTKLIRVGGMRHLYDLSPDERIEAGKWSWVSQPFVILGFATGKISVGLLLLRVVWESAYWRKWMIMFAMGSALVITIINIVLTFAQCSPTEALWNPALIAQGAAECWPPSVQTNFAIFLSSWNILTDVFLAVMPATFMYNLVLNTRKKIGLCILLGLSFAAAIFATVKTKYLTSLAGRSDITWETYDLYVWSASELFVIIVCGSVPPIKPVYDFIIGKPPHSSARATGYGGYASGSYPHGGSRTSRASKASRPSDPFRSRDDEMELYRTDTATSIDQSVYPSTQDIHHHQPATSTSH